MRFFEKFKKEKKHKRENGKNSYKEGCLESNYNSNQSASGLIKQFPYGEEEKKAYVSSLTPREKDIYLLMIEGFTLKEIAKQSGIKYSTVNTYMTRIYKKLKVKSRAQLIINYRNIR